MMEANQIRQPLLIVVAGRPGSGKTTLAYSLAKAVRCPLISRDEIKEGLMNTLAGVEEPQDIAWQTYAAFFAVIELLLKRRVTLIAEAAFQHERWAQKLDPLKRIAHIRIVLCTLDAQLARTRQLGRGLADAGRDRFQPVAGGEPSIRAWKAPHLGVPLLSVDTTDEYQPAFESIVRFASTRNN